MKYYTKALTFLLIFISVSCNDSLKNPFKIESYKEDLILIQEQYGDSIYINLDTFISNVILLRDNDLDDGLFDKLLGEDFYGVNSLKIVYNTKVNNSLDELEIISTDGGKELKALYEEWKKGSNIKKEMSFLDWQLDTTDLSLETIENLPKFQNCIKSNDNKECFTKELNKEIRKNFYKSPQLKKILSSKNFAVGLRVWATIRIDEKGNFYLENTETRYGSILSKEDEAAIKNNVQRILNDFPQIEPGRHLNRPRSIKFNHPITFN